METAEGEFVSELAKQNSLKAAETLRKFLREMGMNPEERDFEGGIAFLVTLEGPVDQGVAQIHVEAERFVFHFVFQGYVQPDRRLSVAELITRANWGIIEGNFELNFETGVLRYKTGIDFTFTELTEPLIRNAILDGMETIERFVDPLSGVLEGRLDPAQALRP